MSDNETQKSIVTRDGADLTKWICLMVWVAIFCIIGFTVFCVSSVQSSLQKAPVGETSLLSLMAVFSAVMALVFVVFGFFLFVKASEMKEELKRAAEMNEKIQECKNSAYTEFREQSGEIRTLKADAEREIRGLRDTITLEIDKAAKQAAEKVVEESNKRFKEEADRARQASGKRMEAEQLFSTGNKAIKEGRPKEALKSYNDAIALEPGFAPLHYNRGVALAKLDGMDEALLAFKTAIELDPIYAFAHASLALVLAKKERYVESIESFDKAIELDPDNATAHDGRGVVLCKLGRFMEAIPEHDMAIRLDQKDGSGLYNRACVYSLLYNREKRPEQRAHSLADLAEAIKLDAKFKKQAREDADFQALWDDPDFKKLTEE
ncbi:MAG: tetratricopeptide repeat protein [Candidatus Brocadiia bacterium]